MIGHSIYGEKRTVDFAIEVARGNVPGWRDFFGFGEHSAVNGNNIDIWGGVADIQPEPDPGGYALWIDSSSIDDDIGGNGAKTVSIHYLDTAGVEQTVTAELDGQTAVDTGVTDCMFVQEHHIVEFNGTGIVATGDIDVTKTDGGVIVSRIAAAGNQSMSTMKQVPAGKSLLVTGWHAYGTASTTKIVNLRLRSTAHEGVLNVGVYHFHDSARLKDSGTGHHIPLGFVCPALATVKVSGWSTGAVDCTARWGGYLIDN